MMTPVEMEAVIMNSLSKHLDMGKTLVFVFGSRAEGTEDATSDFDIGLYSEATIPSGPLGDILEELQESDLPVKVDVVDFSKVSDEFKRIALLRTKVWNRPKKNLKFKLSSSLKR